MKEKKIAKISTTESWFFEKINKIDKLLARLIKKKGKTQKNKIRNEKEVTVDNAEIQKKKIIWDYNEQLYANKIDSPKEMDKFLEQYNLPRLNKGKIEYMSRPITNCEIVIKIFQQTKAQGQMVSQVNSTKHLEML